MAVKNFRLRFYKNIIQFNICPFCRSRDEVCTHREVNRCGKPRQNLKSKNWHFEKFWKYLRNAYDEQGHKLWKRGLVSDRYNKH